MEIPEYVFNFFSVCQNWLCSLLIVIVRNVGFSVLLEIPPCCYLRFVIGNNNLVDKLRTKKSTSDNQQVNLPLHTSIIP